MDFSPEPKSQRDPIDTVVKAIARAKSSVAGALCVFVAIPRQHKAWIPMVHISAQPKCP
jgi:hypothetical protein